MPPKGQKRSNFIEFYKKSLIRPPPGTDRGPGKRTRARHVDAYFHSRSRESQIGAAVSQQSRPLGSREQLEAQVRQFAAERPGEVPRPSYWKGYCVYPEQIEFWLDGENRLHNRFLFTRENNAWTTIRLYP